ncbi:hypothetical protein GCM10009087_01610 [Sphingomonas oligophenolica]
MPPKRADWNIVPELALARSFIEGFACSAPYGGKQQAGHPKYEAEPAVTSPSKARPGSIAGTRPYPDP